MLRRGRRLPPGHPAARDHAGLGLAPEDRKSQGLLLEWSLTKNVSLADLGASAARLLDLAPSARRCAGQLRVAEHGAGRRRPAARELSGGNQQKVVLARWLLRECRVLLLDEPTRGVDVPTKAEIYRLITDLATAGLGVLVVSSELEELVGICTRILVMREGDLVAEVDGESATEHELLRHAVAPVDAPVLTEEVAVSAARPPPRAGSRASRGARAAGVRARDRRRAAVRRGRDPQAGLVPDLGQRPQHAHARRASSGCSRSG